MSRYIDEKDSIKYDRELQKLIDDKNSLMKLSDSSDIQEMIQNLERQIKEMIKNGRPLVAAQHAASAAQHHAASAPAQRATSSGPSMAQKSSVSITVTSPSGSTSVPLSTTQASLLKTKCDTLKQEIAELTIRQNAAIKNRDKKAATMLGETLTEKKCMFSDMEDELAKASAMSVDQMRTELKGLIIKKDALDKQINELSMKISQIANKDAHTTEEGDDDQYNRMASMHETFTARYGYSPV